MNDYAAFCLAWIGEIARGGLTLDEQIDGARHIQRRWPDRAHHWGVFLDDCRERRAQRAPARDGGDPDADGTYQLRRGGDGGGQPGPVAQEPDGVTEPFPWEVVA